MNTTSLVFFTLILVLRAAAAAAAEDPTHAGHEQHPPSQELTPEPTESERAHVAPDPPQHPMHEMSNERMIELM
jgi:hypothetical protein